MGGCRPLCVDCNASSNQSGALLWVCSVRCDGRRGRILERDCAPASLRVCFSASLREHCAWFRGFSRVPADPGAKPIPLTCAVPIGLSGSVPQTGVNVVPFYFSPADGRVFVVYFSTGHSAWLMSGRPVFKAACQVGSLFWFRVYRVRAMPKVCRSPGCGPRLLDHLLHLLHLHLRRGRAWLLSILHFCSAFWAGCLQGCEGCASIGGGSGSDPSGWPAALGSERKE